MLKSKQKQPERIDAYPIGININQVHDFVKNIREFGSHDGAIGAVEISVEDLGIREAVQLHFHNLRIRVLSLYEDWSHRKQRAEKKLEEVVQLIKTNELLIPKLDHVRLFRGLIYVAAGLLFFLGEVDFSKDTIIQGFGKTYDSKWLTWSLILALSSVTILLKIAFERFIEPFYDERDPRAHQANIRKFYFGVGIFTISSFTILATLRAVYAKYQKISIDGNVYEAIYNSNPYLSSLSMVAIALLFLIGGTICLTVGLKELSQWYKLKKVKRFLKKTAKLKKTAEQELETCLKYFNRYMNSMQFMNNQELFNQYIEYEIAFALAQYNRGKLEGHANPSVNQKDTKKIQTKTVSDASLNNDTPQIQINHHNPVYVQNNGDGNDLNSEEITQQPTNADINGEFIGEDIQPRDEYIDPLKGFHLLVRKKLDDTAALQ